jgi:DNA replication protein DnaC
MVQQYKRQPRVIVKCETEANKVILVGQDGVGKDAAMMEDIMQGSIKVDGLSIPRLISKNKEYFENLRIKSKSPHKQRERQQQMES